MNESPAEQSPIVADIFQLFVNRADCHLSWRGHWILKRQAMTPALVDRAFREPLPLGVHAVSGIGTSRWTCFDADEDSLVQRLRALFVGLPEGSRLFERSRRGAHVWFFHQSLPWEQVSAAGMERARQHGLGSIEVYPRHGGFNAVRLPGTVHPKTGMRYEVINPTSGLALPFEAALREIRAYALDAAFVPMRAAVSNSQSQLDGTVSADFEELFNALLAITDLRIYAINRAAGICPWHDDSAPSLFVKGRRFHCLACRVFGDIYDLRRWTRKGIRPPS